MLRESPGQLGQGLFPLGIRDVDAVIDDGRSLAHPAQGGSVRRVAPDVVHPIRELNILSSKGACGKSPRRQFAYDGAASAAGRTEHDMKSSHTDPKASRAEAVVRVSQANRATAIVMERSSAHIFARWPPCPLPSYPSVLPFRERQEGARNRRGSSRAAHFFHALKGQVYGLCRLGPLRPDSHKPPQGGPPVREQRPGLRASGEVVMALHDG